MFIVIIMEMQKKVYPMGKMRSFVKVKNVVPYLQLYFEGLTVKG
jgi:hypothetical protein